MDGQEHYREGTGGAAMRHRHMPTERHIGAAAEPEAPRGAP